MKKLLFFITIFGVVIFLSCHKESPNEPPQVTIQPQVDIPWPSLANSPWPMFHHDPQSTGRSQYTGPRKGRIKWVFYPDNNAQIYPGIIIGSDSTIYFSTTYEKTVQGHNSFLYAIRPDGTLKWKYKFDSPYAPETSVPLIAADRTIFIAGGGSDHYLYAINTDGTLKWKRYASITSSLNIGLDGTLYFRGGDGYLNAMSQDGVLLWKTTIDQGFYYYGISLSPDSKTIYLFNRITPPNLQGYISSLCAVGTDGVLRWKYAPGDSFRCLASPLVDSDGNIYFGAEGTPLYNSKIYSISADGNLNWSYRCGGGCGSEDPTMDRYGYLYIHAWLENMAIISLDYEGNFRWQDEQNKYPYAANICDNEGVVYIFQPDVTAYDSHGKLLWQLPLEGRISRIASPAIGFNGILYVGTYGDTNKLYAIE